jgi:hypothetical protein
VKKLIIMAFALIVGVFVSGSAGRVQAGAASVPASATQAQIVKSNAVSVWYRRHYRWRYYRPYYRHYHRWHYYRRHYYHRYYYRPYYRRYYYHRYYRRRCCW